MIEALLSLGAGIILGVAFALLGAPVPAPPSIAGVAGVLGLTLGYILIGGSR